MLSKTNLRKFTILAGSTTTVLAPIYATAFIGMVIFFIFPVQIPFYLVANNDVSSSQIGLALSLQTLSSVIMAL